MEIQMTQAQTVFTVFFAIIWGAILSQSISRYRLFETYLLFLSDYKKRVWNRMFAGHLIVDGLH